MKLGIAIPCYINHIPLLKRCLDSIEAQTRKPDLVIVHSSSTDETQIPTSYSSYKFPLKIIPCPLELNASQNRNAAAAALCEEGCTYISFFDADDEMHPQRLEAIYKAVIDYPLTQMIVHSYTMELSFETKYYPTFTYLVNKLIPIENTNGIGIEDENTILVHHGHVTVHSDILKTLEFPEQHYFSRKGESGGIEDSIFCRSVLELNIENIFIRDCLSIYYPSFVQNTAA